MCGICGKLTWDARPPEEALLRRMCAALVHRGPDDEGVYLNDQAGATRGPRAGLGHRRLSIIDLSPLGHQPMPNEDGTVWITFNGEVYNFRELRRDLEARGHRFRSMTDTEVVLHLYEEHGPEVVQHLRGFFAFGIWDQRRGQLVLARDRVGKKPLYYAVTAGGLTFASEIAALLEDPDVPREPDFEAIHHYLTLQYVPAPLTAFRAIRKLPPAHRLVWERGSLRVERYWRLRFTPKLRLSVPEAGEALLAHLREAVRLRLVADVPLGAFLSGGIDSSTVVGLMSELTGSAPKTISIGFEEEGYDELRYARTVARRFGTDHHEIVVKPDAVEVLPELVRHYGEPFADSSAIPTYYVSRAARALVTVALTGDGGDENFAGYDRYVASRLARLYTGLPGPARRLGAWLLVHGALRLVPPVNGKSLGARVARFFESAGREPEERYCRWICHFTPEQKAALYTEEFIRAGALPPTSELLFREGRGRSGDDSVDDLLALDVETYLPDDLLVKVDVAAMMNSLETRAPFLDHVLMEFVARLPSRMKLRGLTKKYLLRRALKGWMPPEILRRRKMGFGVPLELWLRKDLREYAQDLLLDRRTAARGLFRASMVERMLADHFAGRADYRNQLWNLLCLELWSRTFIDHG